MVIGGWLSTIVVATIPLLWRALTSPKGLAWDQQHATAAERELARHANRDSHIQALVSAT